MTLQRMEQGLALKPHEVVAEAQERANVLMAIVEDKKLYATFSGKKYLEAEAWQTICAFDKACPITEWTREMKDSNGETIGYVARVNIVKDGETIAAGEMSCGFEEFPCRGKVGIAKHRAAMSAAQTWAGAKAARMKYAWVAVLAGYEPTPAAEMQGIDGQETPEVAERGFCPVHKVAFIHRTGTAKGTGKPYDFWSCPEKLANGSWCQEKPSEIDEAVTDVQEADWAAQFKRETARLTMTSEQIKTFMQTNFPNAHAWKDLTEAQKEEAVTKLRAVTVPEDDSPF